MFWLLLGSQGHFSVFRALPGAQQTGREQSQMTQAGQKGIPDHMMSFSVYKLELAEGQIPFLRNKQVGCAMGGEELHVYHLFCIFYYIILSSFAVLFNCLFLSPQIFLIFIFLPIPFWAWVVWLMVSHCLHGPSC